MQTARGAKLSPLHHRLVAQGAHFRDVSGWEGADWYAGPARRRSRPAHVGTAGVLGAVAAEHGAARDASS